MIALRYYKCTVTTTKIFAYKYPFFYTVFLLITKDANLMAYNVDIEMIRI